MLLKFLNFKEILCLMYGENFNANPHYTASADNKFPWKEYPVTTGIFLREKSKSQIKSSCCNK